MERAESLSVRDRFSFPELDRLVVTNYLIRRGWYAPASVRGLPSDPISTQDAVTRGLLGEPTGHTLLNHTSHWQYVLPRVG